MGVLRNFESRLERGIEGFFRAAFRSGLQPVELAKRILREMEANKTVGVREVWVPNRSVLGRLQGSEIEIQDPGASRRHAEIRRQGQEFVVVDLGSTNGTLVNDRP